MNMKQIQKEALNLAEDERAALAKTLLISLEPSSSESMAEAWLDEAAARAHEIDQGTIQTIPSHQVMAKALALLK